MNDLPLHAEETPPVPARAQDDAFDDAYGWVGYESASPLSFSGAEAAVWPGAVERAPG